MELNAALTHNRAMRVGDEFDSHLATGCGGDDLQLRVDEPDTVTIVVRSRWMGQSPFAARLVCRRVAQDAAFGWLRVVSLIAIEGESERVLTLPELPFPPLLEYIVRAQTDFVIPPDADLAWMRDLGYAAWNEHWQLLVWVHPRFERYTPIDDEDELPEGAAALNRSLALLDKARFERT
jgi:hypothetical protein